MNFGEMLGFTKRLKDIVESTQSKHARLLSLMRDLKAAYGIPDKKDENFEKKNPFVMKFHRTVSEEMEQQKRHVR